MSKKKPGTFDWSISVLEGELPGNGGRNYDAWEKKRVEFFRIPIQRRAELLRAAIAVLRACEKAMIILPYIMYDAEPASENLARAILRARKVAERNRKVAERNRKEKK